MSSLAFVTGVLALFALAGAADLSVAVEDEASLLQLAVGDDAKEQSTSKAWNSWFDSLLVKWREVEPENAELYDKWLQDTERETLEACKSKKPLENAGSIRAKQGLQQFELCQLEWTIKHKSQPPVTVPVKMLQRLVSEPEPAAAMPTEEHAFALPADQLQPVAESSAQPFYSEPVQTALVSSAQPMEQPMMHPIEQPMQAVSPAVQPMEQSMAPQVQQPAEQMQQSMAQPIMAQPMTQPMQFAQMYTQPTFGMQLQPQLPLYPPERTVAFTGLPNFNNAVLGAQGIPNLQNMPIPQQLQLAQPRQEPQQQPAASFDAVKDWERILSFDHDLKSGKASSHKKRKL